MNLIFVEGGTFSMGNTRNYRHACSDEKPVHTVKLTYNYCIGKYPLLFKEYDLAGTPASSFSGRSNYELCKKCMPVFNVSWFDAIAYCNWLSEKEGLPIAYDDTGNLLDSYGCITMYISKVAGYRLPTETEWEYAARGGQKASKDWIYAGSDDVFKVGWDDTQDIQQVGLKAPNELGLYDMSGNICEWCHDWYGTYASVIQIDPTGPLEGENRVTRGGRWYGYYTGSRVTHRGLSTPYGRSLYYAGFEIGFRIARTCSKKEEEI
jgi:formylglycine-generating enzyme required for sulfatase activity